MFLVLLVLSMQHAIVIASIGATAFIVFIFPHSLTAKPRNVVGGHLIGYFCGLLSTLLPHPTRILSILSYSLAVGLSILLMTILDAEHPPAFGTALGTAITGYTYEALSTIIISTIVMIIIRHLLRKHLVNLV